MKTVRLETLEPGARFEVPGCRSGTVVRQGVGTVSVRYDGLQEVEVNGVKFRRPNAAITIAPRTEVLLLPPEAT